MSPLYLQKGQPLVDPAKSKLQRGPRAGQKLDSFPCKRVTALLAKGLAKFCFKLAAQPQGPVGRCKSRLVGHLVPDRQEAVF